MSPRVCSLGKEQASWHRAYGLKLAAFDHGTIAKAIAIEMQWRGNERNFGAMKHYQWYGAIDAAACCSCWR
jgi:hypothetical protein